MWDQNFQNLLVNSGITEWSVENPLYPIDPYHTNRYGYLTGSSSVSFNCTNVNLCAELKKQYWCRQTDERIEFRPPDNFAPDKNNSKHYLVWCRFVCPTSDFEKNIVSLIEKVQWTSYSSQFDDLITKELTISKK
jgi:hypothetical protein